MADLGAIGVSRYSVNRRALDTSDFPTVYGKFKSGLKTSSNVIVSIDILRKVNTHNSSYSRYLPTSDLSLFKVHEKCPPELTSRHIQVWSTRPMTNWNTVPAQIYLNHVPGTISGTLKTSVVIDANHIVRLYYRPTGYMIDQVRTDVNGTFTFNKDIDKQEIGNYYVMAFDLNNSFNAVVYDLLTPG